MLGGSMGEGAMNVHQQRTWKTIYYLVIHWILFGIAHTFEQRRLTSICPPNNDDTDVVVCSSEFRNFLERELNNSGRCVRTARRS